MLTARAQNKYDYSSCFAALQTRARKALYFTKSADVSAALDWLFAHGEGKRLAQFRSVQLEVRMM